MRATYMFAGLPVSDYATAYDWYVRLLNRPADMFPHDGEAVWRLSSTGAIYVVEDVERAGTGLLTVALADLDAHEAHLVALGCAFAERRDGDAPRRLVVEDNDGNTLTFFQNSDDVTA